LAAIDTALIRHRLEGDGFGEAALITEALFRRGPMTGSFYKCILKMRVVKGA
jgi:hypothetical protein